MNDAELDRLLVAAAPIDDAEVALLALSGSDDLCEAIMSTPVIETAPAPEPEPEPESEDVAEAAGRSRAERRPWFRRTRLAVAGAAVAASVAAVAVVQPFGSDGGESAWAAEAVEVAESVPRLLVSAEGWEVIRADEFGVDAGQVTFRGPGGAEIDLTWAAESVENHSYAEVLANFRDDPYEQLADTEIAGEQAHVFEADIGSRPEQAGIVEEGVGEVRAVALWRVGGYVVVAQGDVPTDLFRGVAGTIEVVDVDTWLSALPASVVRSGERPGVVREMLADIPLPEGFDAAALEATDVSARDRYQLGAEVTGQVACAWIAQWSEALARGHAAAAEEAVQAMGTTHDWAVLQEMEAEGAWSDVVWELADSMAQGTTLIGRPDAPITEVAPSALGCPADETPTRADS